MEDGPTRTHTLQASLTHLLARRTGANTHTHAHAAREWLEEPTRGPTHGPHTVPPSVPLGLPQADGTRDHTLGACEQRLTHRRRCAQESYIIHYGLHCAVGSFKFTKYSFGGFDANACSGKTFGDPPAPRHTERRCLRAVELWNSVSSHRMP